MSGPAGAAGALERCRNADCVPLTCSWAVGILNTRAAVAVPIFECLDKSNEIIRSHK